MNVLAFFAHPDDETMLIGGTLALLAQNGANVHYLCATRGEGGETGEPPVCTLAELGTQRERELRCAVQTLGGTSLAFLDYIDPRVGPDEELYPYTDDINAVSSQVAAHIYRNAIDVIITHGSNGEYGHPAHILTHQTTRNAVRSINGDGSKISFYSVAANFPDHPRPRLANKDDPAHLILDITSALPQKTEAALCHQSQLALFVRRSSQKAGRQMTVPEVIMRVESLHRAIPNTDQDLEDELTGLLQPWVLVNQKD